MEANSSIREFIVSRDQLVVHPAIKEIFDLSRTIEFEVDIKKISDEVLGLQQFLSPLIVEKLAPNSYGFIANWLYLLVQHDQQIFCREYPCKLEEVDLKNIAWISLASQLFWMPRISHALAPLVRVTREFPDYLKNMDSVTARANASIERAVAGIVRSDLSTVRSHVRSEREQREKHKAKANEILRGIIR
jgi:hypothetical protein